ncbi:hypothetical protein PFISCL1PPCAC_22668, partial [Pristionchus fissidentatus]
HSHLADALSRRHVPHSHHLVGGAREQFRGKKPPDLHVGGALVNVLRAGGDERVALEATLLRYKQLNRLPYHWWAPWGEKAA